MALITGGHLQRFLQKFFGVKGEIVSPEVGPEVHPVIPITNLPMEHRFLDSITTWYKEANATGDATHPGTWFFANAVNSNVQVKILRLEILYTPSAVASPLSIIIGATNPTNYAAGSAGFLLDSRARTVFSQRSVSHVGAIANQVGTGVVNHWPIAQPVSGTQLHVLSACGSELILNPGEQLYVNTAQNTEAIKGQVWWTERFLEPSEATA